MEFGWLTDNNPWENKKLHFEKRTQQRYFNRKSNSRLPIGSVKRLPDHHTRMGLCQLAWWEVTISAQSIWSALAFSFSMWGTWTQLLGLSKWSPDLCRRGGLEAFCTWLCVLFHLLSPFPGDTSPRKKHVRTAHSIVTLAMLVLLCLLKALSGSQLLARTLEPSTNYFTHVELT